MARRRGNRRAQRGVRPERRKCASRSAVIHSSAPGACSRANAPLPSQLFAPAWPAGLDRRLRRGDEAEPDQRIVQLVGVGGLGPRLFADAGESPRGRGGRDRRPPPGRASAGSSPPGCGAPPAGRRRDRRRAAPDNTSRAERRGLGQVARHHVDGAGFEAAQQALQPFDVHRLGKAVAAIVCGPAEWSGDLARADQILAAGDLVGKIAPTRSSAPMRASCGGTLRPPRKRGKASATPTAQRQRVVNIGASSKRLDQHVADARRMQVALDVVERESCARWSATG